MTHTQSCVLSSAINATKQQFARGLERNSKALAELTFETPVGLSKKHREIKLSIKTVQTDMSNVTCSELHAICTCMTKQLMATAHE